MPSVTAITTAQFSRLIGLPHSPAVVDVRIDDDYRADPRFIDLIARCAFSRWSAGPRVRGAARPRGREAARALGR